MNEIGLDPGIDHLATIKVRDEVHAKGGKYYKFYLELLNMNLGVVVYQAQNSVITHLAISFRGVLLLQ